MTNPAYQAALTHDLAQANTAIILAYKIQRAFFCDLFAPLADHGNITLLCDHRMAPIAQDLMRAFPGLSAFTWARNRLMHSKIILLPELEVAYVGSHNLTRYAHTCAINHTVRIAHRSLVEHLHWKILRLLRASKPLAPRD